MKITWQMCKDLGACQSSLDTVELYAKSIGETKETFSIDYTKGMEVWKWLAAKYAPTEQNAIEGHGNPDSWMSWAFNLRHRVEAITYHKDHHEDEVWKTSDGVEHLSLEEARSYRSSYFNDKLAEAQPVLTINGVTVSEAGETWQVVDIDALDKEYDAWVWFNPKTGINHRTTSLTAVKFFVEQNKKILNDVEAERNSFKIFRRISDESREYAVWMEIE